MDAPGRERERTEPREHCRESVSRRRRGRGLRGYVVLDRIGDLVPLDYERDVVGTVRTIERRGLVEKRLLVHVIDSSNRRAGSVRALLSRRTAHARRVGETPSVSRMPAIAIGAAA